MTSLSHFGGAFGRPAIQPSHSQPTSLRARVKWYDAHKGFGFVAPLNGAPDAFLHASTLTRAGIAQVPEGAEVVCDVVAGPKGPQVVQVHEVEIPAEGETLRLDGEVKWYSPDKGFGFVVADDHGRDVFIHKSVLRRAGLDGLDSGTRVTLRAVETGKGREAVEIV